MPLMKCKNKGKKGTKFGKSGKCYTGKSGKKKAQVAREMKKDPATIGNILERFEEEGAKGLVIKRKRGAYKVTDDVEKLILAEKAKHPDAPSETIAENLKEGNIEVGEGSVRNVLKKYGIQDLKKRLDRV